MNLNRCKPKGGAAFERQRFLRGEEYQNTLSKLMQIARSAVLGTEDIAALDKLSPSERQGASVLIRDEYLALCRELGVQPR